MPQWTEVDGTVAVITELGGLIVGRYSCVSGIALRPAQWSLRIRRLGQCLSDLGELCVLGPRMQSVSSSLGHWHKVCWDSLRCVVVDPLKYMKKTSSTMLITISVLYLVTPSADI